MERTTEPVPFILLPEVSIVALLAEIRPIAGEDMAHSVLFRVGVRIGSDLADALVRETPDLSSAFEAFKAVWGECGLGDVMEGSGPTPSGEIEIVIGRSLEARIDSEEPRPRCHLLRGTLSGFFSQVLGEPARAEEVVCRPTDCRFLLTTRSSMEAQDQRPKKDEQ